MPRDLLADLTPNKAPVNLLAGSVEPRKSWNIFGDPEAFRNQVNELESSPFGAGIAGANEMFTKIFGSKSLAEQAAAKAEQAAKLHPRARTVGKLGAGIYSSVPFGMVGTSAAARVIPKASQFAQGVLGGGAGLGAMGALKTPMGDETRLGNTLEDMAYGMVAPGIGKAAGYGAGQALKGTKFLVGETGKSILNPIRLTYPEIAKQVERDAAKLITKGSDKFNSVFKVTDEAGFGTLENFKVPPKLMMGLKKFAGKEDYNTALNRFFQDKTLDNAKKLSSDLFKFTKNYKKLPSTSKTSEGNLANKAAINFRKILEDRIKDNVKKAGGDKLLNSYEGANKFWADNVADVANSKLLSKFQSRGATAKMAASKDFVKDIVKTKAGRAELKKIAPSATYRMLLNNLAKGAGALTVLGGGGTAAWKKLNENK